MYSKKEVGFEHPAKGPNNCGQCKHYEGGSCAIVSGTILVNDWCERFKMKHTSGKAQPEPKPAQKNPHGYDRCAGSCSAPQPQDYVKEHQMIPSRLGGRAREVSFGPLPGGLVPANPFASLAQAGFMHTHPEVLGKKGLAEWDAATKGKKLPKHVKKSK